MVSENFIPFTFNALIPNVAVKYIILDSSNSKILLYNISPAVTNPSLGLKTVNLGLKVSLTW